MVLERVVEHALRLLFFGSEWTGILASRGVSRLCSRGDGNG